MHEGRPLVRLITDVNAVSWGDLGFAQDWPCSSREVILMPARRHLEITAELP